MIIVPIFMMLLFLFWNLNTMAFKKMVNYANMFLLIWCILPAISAFGLFEFVVPPMEAYFYIILMIICFEVGTLFFINVKFASNGKKYKQNIEDINWVMMLIISIACFLFMVPFFMTSLKYTLSNGFHFLRYVVLSNEIITIKNRVIIRDIVQPLIIITTMASLYELVETRKFKLITLVCIINCCIYSMTLAGRLLLMEVFYIIIVFLIQKYSLNILTIIRNNKQIIRLGIAFVVGMLFITFKRSVLGSTGPLYDVYAYFIGSIHFFGLAISQPQTFALEGGGYLYGKELFSSLIEFVNNIVKMFNQPIILQSGISKINEVTQKFYYVSPITHMNNNITMVYGFMRDFGIIGIIFDTLVLSILYMKLYKTKEKSVYHKLKYSFGVSLLPFLVFEWFYGRTFVLIVYLILSILPLIDRKKEGFAQ